jgi:hypothetical protein
MLALHLADPDLFDGGVRVGVWAVGLAAVALWWGLWQLWSRAGTRSGSWSHRTS